MFKIRAQAPFPESSQQACDVCGCLCIHNAQILAAAEHSQGSECQECWELSDPLGLVLRGLVQMTYSKPSRRRYRTP